MLRTFQTCSGHLLLGLGVQLNQLQDRGQDCSQDHGQDRGLDRGQDCGQGCGRDCGQDRGQDYGQDRGCKTTKTNKINQTNSFLNLE